MRVIARQVRDKNCLAAIFAPRHQSVSSGPLGGKERKNAQNRKEFLEKENGKEIQKGKEKKIRGLTGSGNRMIRDSVFLCG